MTADDLLWEEIADASLTRDGLRERAACVEWHESEARRARRIADLIQHRERVTVADLAFAVTLYHQSTEHVLEAVRLTTSPRPNPAGLARADEATRPV